MNKTNHLELGAKHAFSAHLLQDGIAGRVQQGAECKGQGFPGGDQTVISYSRQESQEAEFKDQTEIPDGDVPLSPNCDEFPVAHRSEDHATQFGALWNAPPPFNVSWGSVSCQSRTGPAHNGGGTYVYRLSPSGDISALAVNEKKAKNIRVLFFSSLTPGELSSTVYPLSKENGR
jgi:hypothetical protein